MTGIRMTDYDAQHRAHRLDIPTTFNFGRDVVDRLAEDPARIALVWCNADGDERSLTFADISRASNQVANWLTGRGVNKGDRVIVMLPRIPEWQISMVACLKIGAIPIPCITMLTERDIAYRIEHSGAVAAITTASESSKFGSAPSITVRLSVGGAPGDWFDFKDTTASGSDFDANEIGAEEPAVVYYTSGSTGDPKGVCHASRALLAWRVSAAYWLSLGPNDVMWCTADTGWAKAGTSILFGPWLQGSTVLFYDGPFDAAKRFELIQRHSVTVFCAAATELRRLVLEDASSFDLSSLRLTVSAGESVNPEVITAWTQMVGGPLLDGYGQTETLMTVLNYDGMPIKPGSMGKPLPGVIAGIASDDGRIVDGPGEGQLIIKRPNPQLMLGYWNDTERTSQTVLRDDDAEWFLTGDNVRRDDDGYLFYLGRDDDIINSAGYRIGPQEVENALIEHPSVQESAVIGVPGAERGEIVKAYVVLSDPALGGAQLVETLQAHVRATTAPYKYPRQIEFVSDLPKTVTGKIQRNLLRERARKAGPSTS